jgi:putative transcriptional regulator
MKVASLDKALKLWGLGPALVGTAATFYIASAREAPPQVMHAERSWSQQELGMRVGVSRQAINAVETGKFDPSSPLALKLARVFDTTVEALFQLDGEG